MFITVIKFVSKLVVALVINAVFAGGVCHALSGAAPSVTVAIILAVISLTATYFLFTKK